MATMNIIKNGRITEKAAVGLDKNVYTFDVFPSANKTEIKKAIFTLYKVKPVRVNILAIPRKQILARGKEGMKGGGKKALVYLKKGDKIELI